MCFDLTRQTANKIVREKLAPLLSNFGRVNSPLRHFRLTHLAVHYNFQVHELSQIAGWTTRTGMGLLGTSVSPNVDMYLHLQWKQYVEKLFVPLSEVLSTFTVASPKDYEIEKEEGFLDKTMASWEN